MKRFVLGTIVFIVGATVLAAMKEFKINGVIPLIIFFLVFWFIFIKAIKK